MTDITLPAASASPVAAVAATGTPAAATPGNAPADTPDTQAGGQFLNTLMMQLLGAVVPAAADAAPAAGSAATGDAVSNNAPHAQSGNDKQPADGTILPDAGQNLPLDPGLMVLTPPNVTPPHIDAATPAVALKSDGSAQEGNAGGARLRLNLPPLASPVAQLAVQQVKGETALEPGLIAAAAQQHDGFNALHAELSALATAAAPGATSGSATGSAVAALAVAAPTPTVNAPTGAVPPAITVPVTQPGWDQALGQRVQWMVNQQMQNAELHINPPHLGPLEVRISIGQDQQASIAFASPHGMVRDAIESAVPQLRNLLGDSGLNLVNVNVSQHSFAEQRRQALPQNAGRDAGYTQAAQDVTAVPGSGAVSRAGLGLVDYFA